MTARRYHMTVAALGLVALSCSGGGGGPRSSASPSTTSVVAPAAGEPTTVAGPIESTTSSTSSTASTSTTGPSTTSVPTTTTVPDNAPPPTVPFVDAPPTTSALGLVRADVGVAYPFVLSTECGIAGTEFDQREWRNDPPLADPGTRPAGWNPSYEQGTMTLTTADVAEFTSGDGLRTARFVPRPAGSPDLPACP